MAGAVCGTATASTQKKTPSREISMKKPLEPMYASVGKSMPGEGWTFEPKYDGVRVLAYVTAEEALLVTRNGKDKSAQFPEVVEELQKIAKRKKKNFVADGEIVALADGEPARFQELQSRMHVKDASLIARHRTSTPAALILFDLLVIEDDVLVSEPMENTESAARKGVRQVIVPGNSRHRIDRGQRREDARKGAQAGLGGCHREAHRLPLRTRYTLARLAQAQD